MVLLLRVRSARQRLEPVWRVQWSTTSWPQFQGSDKYFRNHKNKHSFAVMGLSCVNSRVLLKVQHSMGSECCRVAQASCVFFYYFCAFNRRSRSLLHETPFAPAVLLLHQKPFKPDTPHTKHPLQQTAFYTRNLYAKKAFTHETFDTKKPFTQENSCTKSLSHKKNYVRASSCHKSRLHPEYFYTKNV